MADAGQHIQKLAVLLRRVANPVGRNHGQAMRCSQVQQRLVARLFVALAVSLQFHVEIAVAVDRSQMCIRDSAHPTQAHGAIAGRTFPISEAARPMALLDG